MIPYHRWIGLPHKLGADPADGEAADCLMVAYRVLLEAGIKCPSIKKEWIDLAASGEWVKLEDQWNLIMEPIETPEQYALSMSRNDETGFNIGVVVDDGVLFVHHRKGVAWMPLSFVRASFWRVRSASV